ncbi:hypothetical protein STRAU_7050 [Streptomyces aurantiacus JA 4570]|uniref:Uncharacterized protein n=1 Tax=Streptomyces aurantiacus JA 4570 TaxID=1286094 RepID=S3ZB64_9ACTN|nr:hypothetical protein STRAU_7050 [Streptomyces aurantiacus JA 4570]
MTVVSPTDKYVTARPHVLSRGQTARKVNSARHPTGDCAPLGTTNRGCPFCGASPVGIAQVIETPGKFRRAR